MPFDPDQYLQAKSQGPGFDPDSYLSEKSGNGLSKADLSNRLDSDFKSMGFQGGAKDYINQLNRGAVMGMGAQTMAGMAKNAASRAPGLLSTSTPELAEEAAAGAAPEMAAAETEAPVVNGYRVSRAGPIKNLPRPDAPLFEQVPAADSAASAPISRLPAQVPDQSAIAQRALEVIKKVPMAGKILSGAGLAAGAEVGKVVLDHPELAAKIAAGGVAMTPVGLKAIVKSYMNGAFDAPKPGVSSLKGEDRWAVNGFQNLLQHNPNAVGNEAQVDQMFSNPKARKLLIQAADMKPGSKGMQTIYEQLQSELGGEK